MDVVRTLVIGTLMLGATACTDRPARESAFADEAPATDNPWFGAMLPPGFAPHVLQVIDDRAAAPAVVPEGESQFRELAGSVIQSEASGVGRMMPPADVPGCTYWQVVGQVHSGAAIENSAAIPGLSI